MLVQQETPSNLDVLPAYRLTGTLFFMAFGYALLSVCLFRLLSFTLSSTAFFVLYVAATMPLGAYLAQHKTVAGLRGLRLSLGALAGLAFLLPVLGWLATRGQSLMTVFELSGQPDFDLSIFWQRLGYQLLVVSPFFIAWGFAEFIGYQVAIRSGSRGLKGSFYLIFVWALACALAVGFWAIPRWGWLRTLALAPIVAVLAYDLLRQAGAPWRTRCVPYLVTALIWIAAGRLEGPFIDHLFLNTPWNVGDVLHNHKLPWGTSTSGEASLLRASWGKFTHVELVEYKQTGTSTVFGAYDGVIYWHVYPEKEQGYGLLKAVFDFAPEHADIAVLGAGGGRQVSYALDRNPNSIVAVDIIPEVFTLFQGEYAWANGHVYQSPLVETVAADGRSYLQNSTQQFDLILVPHTESWAAVVRGLFEAGQRIHTVEAFQIIRSHLKPNGIVATVKAVDLHGRLFNTYAASLRQAGLQVVGWLQPRQGLQFFVLLASPNRQALTPSPTLESFFTTNGFQFVDFQATAPTGEAIYDDSPWVQGVLGTMIPPDKLRRMLFGIAAITVIGLAGVMGLSMRKREPGETMATRLVFVLAGVSTGVHAVYLQNGVIFWLIVNLLNPLASFFVGTALFLLAWGLSSTMLKKWHLLLGIGAVGIVGMLISESWHGYGNLMAMGCIALGSGLCFPLLGLTFESRLLNLFIADAAGGFAGGVLGIWVPVLLGFQHYFDFLPWISLSTLILVALTIVVRGRQKVTQLVATRAI